LGIKKGDEVIVQSFTCRTAINPLLQAGAAVKLVDIDEDFRIPIDHLRKKISKNTRAIIATHLYGVPCNIDEISDLAREHDCYLVEDCAQCLGATCRGKKAGTFGHLAVFSFNLDKPISLGEGGMLTINDPGLADAAMAVKATVERAAQSCHVEITTLVIPGLNDSPAEIGRLARWLSGISPDIVLHLSRFFPNYKMLDIPPTPVKTLEEARKSALEFLRHVYLGNV
jgi:dTDP-4-amino-4,6-dideoxygalactose transaminase